MQAVSDLYKELIQDPRHVKEARLNVAGVDHEALKDIWSISTSGALFSTISIGGTVSREINAEFIPKVSIPRAAEVRPYIRVRLGEQVSEWIPKGVFYIDTRKTDDVTGVMTIHGYDAILLHGGETYLAQGDTGDWPRACSVVVADICQRMGLELDERTVLDASITIPYPNDWTIRELLGYIGVAHAGNWTVTDAGKLRLVPLWSIPEETHYLVDQNGDPITFGGVRILV